MIKNIKKAKNKIMLILMIDNIDNLLTDKFTLLSLFDLLKIPSSNLILICTANISNYHSFTNSPSS